MDATVELWISSQVRWVRKIMQFSWIPIHLKYEYAPVVLENAKIVIINSKVKAQSG